MNDPTRDHAYNDRDRASHPYQKLLPAIKPTIHLNGIIAGDITGLEYTHETIRGNGQAREQIDIPKKTT